MWDSILSILLGAAAGVAIGYATYKIVGVINRRRIEQAAKEKFDRAFKAIIKEKKKNAVKVGIFDSNNTVIASDYTIESDQGVASDIYVGQTIYL